jgi:ketosteroid isomerase-like protein
VRDLAIPLTGDTMRVLRALLLLVLVGPSPSLAASIVKVQSNLPDGDAAGLVAAERAFNRMAAEKNIRDAFFEYMADNSILFRPGPVNGKEFFRARPANPGPVLTWYPMYAEISGTGDLGWTTGPWEFRSAKDKPAEGWGHFASVWQKQISGQWKVVFDEGHSCERPPQDSLTWARLAGTVGPDAAPSLKTLSAGLNRLTMVDGQYSQALVEKGIEEALKLYGDDAVLVLREEKPLMKGAEAAGKALAKEWDGGVTAWATQAGAMSKSADLAFTYGTVTLPSKDAKGPAPARKVFRIWHRIPEEGWKLALDATNTMAPPPAPPAPPKTP